MPNWGNEQDEKRETIANMEIWCSERGYEMPDVNARMRLDIINEEFNKLKKEFWDRLVQKCKNRE